METEDELEITEPLIKTENAVEAPDTEEALRGPCRLESLDYQVVENDLYKQDWRSRSRAVILGYTVNKWILAFMVGFSTAVLAIVINVAIENIAGTRFLVTTNLMDSKRYASAFAFYSGSNVALVLLSALVCVSFAPAAAGSGVPEVKAYLNGVNVSDMLSLKVLVVKTVGIVGAVSSGLICGKAGPLVHMGSCVGYVFSQIMSTLRDFKAFSLLATDKDRRDLVTCGAAAGFAGAFRSPLGGTLFALEEMSSWWRSSLIWRLSFTTAIVAVVLRVGNKLCRSGKCGLWQGGLIMFDVSALTVSYEFVDLVPITILGLTGGMLGSLYNHLNAHFFLFNTRWQNQKGLFLKLLHASSIAFVTSVCSFGLPWLVPCKPCPEGIDVPCPTHGRVGNFKRFNCPSGHYNDLAGLIFNTTEDAIRNLFSMGTRSEFQYSSLVIFTVAAYGLALMTYGILVPSGLFVPAILFGATYGRIMGMIMARFFGHKQMDESVYALLGAASFMGGSIRRTVSLCLILLELTDNYNLLPLIMFSLLIAKIVGDLFNHGIFRLHIRIKGFPFLDGVPESCLSLITAGDVAIRKPLVKLSKVERLESVLEVLNCTRHNAFPVIDFDASGKPLLFGLVLRSHILDFLDSKRHQLRMSSACELNGSLIYIRDSPVICSKVNTIEKLVDLTPIVNQSPYTVLETMSLAKAYVMFRQLGLRHLCVLSNVKDKDAPIKGILTRHDFMPEYLLEHHPKLVKTKTNSHFLAHLLRTLQ